MRGEGLPPADRIVLAGMAFSACHGVFAEEKVTPQPFEVDVEMHLDLAAAAATDDLRETVDYGSVFALVQQIVTGPPVNLIETLAGRVGDAVLAFDARVQAVVCRVRKPKAPLPGPFNTVEVTVHRRRQP